MFCGTCNHAEENRENTNGNDVVTKLAHQPFDEQSTGKRTNSHLHSYILTLFLANKCKTTQLSAAICGYGPGKKSVSYHEYLQIVWFHRNFYSIERMPFAFSTDTVFSAFFPFISYLMNTIKNIIRIEP